MCHICATNGLVRAVVSGGQQAHTTPDLRKLE